MKYERRTKGSQSILHSFQSAKNFICMKRVSNYEPITFRQSVRGCVILLGGLRSKHSAKVRNET